MNQTTRSGLFGRLTAAWKRLETKYPKSAQFILFFLLSNGVTVLQMALLPLLKAVFQAAGLEAVPFQFLMFDYGAGSLAAGGGGGLGYFLAVQVTLAIAQVLNFFAQRNITFKSNGNIWRSAFWYLVAYLVISIGAAALQNLYKAPLYALLTTGWGWGQAGEAAADFLTMFINSAISFWVFFPIFRIIFRSEAK